MHIFSEKVEELKNLGVYRKLNVAYGPNDGIQIVNEKNVINLCSNNYLGFANHPRLKAAAINAINEFGVGAGAVRTINGNTVLHEMLDKKIAEFKKEEAAHHFQSGLACNLGVIPVLIQEKDLILSDELNHASIIDGIKLSKGSKKIYRHCDMNHLDEILQQIRKDYENVFIISDGVFSMDGNIAPLPDLVDIAKRHHCFTYIDDAHGSGVLGKSGRGTVDHFNLHKKVDIIIGTLSKAIGSIGGYATGSADMYKWLNHRARPLLFSTALPPSAVAASIEALKILEETEEYTRKLWKNTLFFQDGMKKLGFDTGKTETPITPIHVGEEAKALEVSRKLFENGVYASAIVFPTVPNNKARIRCMISASHDEECLEKAIGIFQKVRDEVKF